LHHVQFHKLRLTGFKSFVDPTELDIEPGLTGVVGPNGCGKSNLVEALKWVMGETSAKQMRGSEMEDVIFAGTNQRPARNIAEVTLKIDNKSRTAPAQFNEADDLEVIRRIERGHGSLYKVNGNEARARDVQTMFADASAGARSTAMVSQGRIGAIINAKPADRRIVIDEAAGITGLYARRHEAELRLRAAEANLARVQDVLNALEEQHRQLKRQARQATRYRNLSDHIRRAEAAVLALKLAQGERDMAEADERLKQAGVAVTDLTRLVGLATTAQAEAATGLPALRQGEAAAAARLQRLKVASEALTAEADRVESARADGRTRLEQISGDLTREEERRDDATTALAGLVGESVRLAAAQVGEQEREAEAAADRDAARAATSAAEQELDRLTRQIADDEALAASVSREIAELNERLARLAARRADVASQREALERELAQLPALAAAEQDSAAAAAALQATRERTHDAVEQARAAERQAHEQALATIAAAETDRLGTEQARAVELRAAESIAAERAAAAQKVSARVTKLRAEEAGIAAALESAKRSLWPPLLDALSVEAGFEKALGAAFGEELEASYDRGAPIYWQALPGIELPGLPAEARRLADVVNAPPELARRLAVIGVVADEATGERLQASLLPGQSLVTVEGAVWRWDGFTMKAGAPTAAATRLSQRNRLAEVRTELAEMAEMLESAEQLHRAALEDVQAARQAQTLVVARAREFERSVAERARQAERAAAEAARQRDEQARRLVGEAERTLGVVRERQAEVARQTAALSARLATLADTATQIAAEQEQAEMRRTFREARRSWIADPAADRQAADALRGNLGGLRMRLLETQAACDTLAREAAARRSRLVQITGEQEGWQGRLSQADGQIRELAQRKGAVETQLAELDARPAQLAEQRETLDRQIHAAEEERQQAADLLATGEGRLAEADRTLKQVEAELAEARETRVRREGEAQQAQRDRQAIVERIAERIRVAPDGLLEVAEAQSVEELPELVQAERRLERLVAERENMGAVNLRAEEEAAELEKQLTAMLGERDDLVAAIGRLRQGIQSLNREGRERFLVAFETVSKHFQELFTKLFGGGRAELRLTESEDPLEAGLEIVASPPGKKLQVMSLLSGGEQALTALSLLFAVFMTNPAPICVLDEVDAPLDDANVERFCNLVESIAERSDTRFLIITHHRVTMARMHRLYGVTMSERGVSQLVSVDLQEADRIAEAA
jgi:chromosome segregation protein